MQSKLLEYVFEYVILRTVTTKKKERGYGGMVDAADLKSVDLKKS